MKISKNEIFDGITNDSDELLGEGVKIIIPSNVIDICTRLEIILGLKLSGHTDTLTEASNLRDKEKFKMNSNIEMLLINFQPNKWNFLVN